MTTAVKASMLAGFFYLSWIGLVAFLLVSGFWDLLKNNQIFDGSPKEEPDLKVKIAGYIMAVSASIVFLVLCSVYKFLKTILLQSMIKSKSKEISIKTFTESLNIDVKQVSDNYFKPAAKNEADLNYDTKTGQPKGPNDCTICVTNKANTLFIPCGHGGVCEQCIREYLKEKDECLFCKALFTEIYLLTESTNKKKILVKGVIRLKR